MASLDQLFGFGVHPLEIVVRGTAVYWFLFLLFLLFRFVLRRDAGSLGIADMLLLVLIADASQNAMSGGYGSLSEGALLVATIAGWNWASWHSATVRRWAEPPPLALVRRGRLMARNLRREHVTTDELMASLREHGVENLGDVKWATMEADGRISIIRADGTAITSPPQRPLG